MGHIRGRRWAAVLSTAVVLCAAAVSGCGEGESGAGGEDPIQIGYIGGITGYLADTDVAFRDGIKIAIDEANARGGTLGRKLTLTVADNQSQPGPMVTALQKLTAGDSVDAVIGGCTSAGARAVAPLLARAKQPATVCAVLPSASDDPTGYKWMFTTAPDLKGSVESALQYMKDQGWTKVAIASDVTPLAKGELALTKGLAPRYGVKIVDTQTFESGDTNLRPILLKLQSSDADVIYTFTGSAPAQAIAVKNRAQANISTPLMGDIGVIPQVVAENAGSAAKGFMFPASDVLRFDLLPEDDADRKQISPFMTAWRDRHGDRDPSWAARGYDAAQLMIKAIERAGGTEGPKLRDALEASEYQGASGDFALSPEVHNGTTDFEIVVMDANGKLSPANP